MKKQCQKLPVDGFEWVDDISKIDENFIKNYDEDSNVGNLIEAERITYFTQLFTILTRKNES